MGDESGKPSWKVRRRIILSTLVFCAFAVLYIMFQGNDTRINETIVLGCFGLAGSVIGFYVAGASWEDISLEKIKSKGSTRKTPSEAGKIDPPKFIDES